MESFEDGIFPAFLIECSDSKSLKRDLKIAKSGWIVGVKAGETSVLREAISRRKVDIILDFPGSRVDYISMKMAAEKDVIMEISMRRFFDTKGSRRMREFEQVLNMINVSRKFSSPIVFTSGAGEFVEMRHTRQLREFFEYLGGDFQKSLNSLRRLIRRYFDETYLMDGLEVIS